MFSLKEVVQKIDHTLLKANATEKEYVQLCCEAKEYGFKAVCVLPYYVPFCVEQLKDSSVVVATVVGFPLGANRFEVKAFEAEKAFADGATEVDMVLSLGALKDGKLKEVLLDIQQVVEVAQTFTNRLVKVIIETGLLTVAEKRLACQLAVEAGADFVKTSTGFNSEGATLEDVSLIVSTVGKKAKVKAAGGIRTWTQAEMLLRAGASRLGTSRGKDIVTQYQEENQML
ncbi:MAG: deoxyribose-phosphate aldolase [Clostridia bacterium]|nr:deoxyribose-phosphate aldolase [Clostridia bacterium]